jgi:hypothetical protein
MINNIDNIYDKNGLDITFINNRTNESLDDDEIQYEPYKSNTGDSNFYGDLCCYSEALCEEQSIQMVDFRFNTMQRELTNSFLASNFISDIIYDEIISDDYDDNGFLYKDDNKFTKASTR